MPIYTARHDLYAAGMSATVICIGDSWFWHPAANLMPGIQNCFMNEHILLIGETTSAGCYDTVAMQSLFTQIFGDIEKLVREVNLRAPNAKVRLHNYDYAIPDGRHLVVAGQWLKVPMDSRKVPQPGSLARGGFRREVIATLIDTFGAWQQNLADRLVNTRFVRTAGTVADNGWLDELHPKAAGFKRIARLLAA